MSEKGISGIPSWCHIGAKIVCVDNTDYHLNIVCGGWTPPEIGKVYTVAHTYPAYLDRGPHVVVAEIDEPDGYSIWRFRPLHSVENDIEAHFKKLLKTPAPKIPKPENVE